jgi:hypothetical protein
MDPKSHGNYSHIIMEAAMWMKMAFVIDSPSDRVPAEASSWDRGRTEVCGGDKIVLGLALGVSGF